MGLEGMVSKRADRPYRAGRSKGEEPQAPGDEQSERPAGSHSVAMIRRDRFAQPDADASHCLGRVLMSAMPRTAARKRIHRGGRSRAQAVWKAEDARL